MNPEDLGRTIGDYRVALGMSQQRVADLIGKSRGYIGQIERGKLPSEDVLVKLVTILCIPLDKVFPMAQLRELDPNLADLMDFVSPQMHLVTEIMTPEQRYELAQSQQKNADMTDRMIEAMSTVKVETGPSGWSQLNKKDRKLVQEIVNRLLSTKRYEEA